jgi:hypothetical protein
LSAVWPPIVGSSASGPLALDDARDHLPRDRLDVRDVRHLGVRHDRRRIRVHENDAIALFAQRLAGLRTRIVELARLADDDRARADDEDRMNVAALRHCYFFSIIFTKRSNR